MRIVVFSTMSILRCGCCWTRLVHSIQLGIDEAHCCCL